jgi:hypothetical protein
LAVNSINSSNAILISGSFLVVKAARAAEDTVHALGIPSAMKDVRAALGGRGAGVRRDGESHAGACSTCRGWAGRGISNETADECPALITEAETKMLR